MREDEPTYLLDRSHHLRGTTTRDCVLNSLHHPRGPGLTDVCEKRRPLVATQVVYGLDVASVAAKHDQVALHIQLDRDMVLTQP